MDRARALSVFAALAVALLAAPPARACAVCSAGDPTLAAMGAERPFDSRLRIAGELRLGGARVGAPGAASVEVREERLELSAAYAPTRSAILSLAIPLLEREASGKLGTARAFVPGDVELRVRGVVAESATARARHHGGVQGGLKLPTAPLEDGPGGVSLAPALQPGGGAIAPFAGAFYGVAARPFSLLAGATLMLPFPVRERAHGGASVRASLSLQHQTGRRFATRLGLSARLEAAGELDGKIDPDSGGAVAYVSPEIIMSPATDLLLTLGAHVPALQALRGEHVERTVFALGVTYDL